MFLRHASLPHQRTLHIISQSHSIRAYAVQNVKTNVRSNQNGYTCTYIYIAYISIHASPLSLASHACPSVCVYGWYLRCVAYSSFTSHTLSRCVSTTLCIYMYMFVCVKESDRQHKTSVNAHLNSPSALIRSCFLLYIVFSHTAQHLARMQTHKAGQTETATDDWRLQQFHIDVSMIYPNSYGEWVHKKTEYFSKV